MLWALLRTGPGQAVIGGALLLAALALYTNWQRNDATDEAFKKIEEQDNAAISTADDARLDFLRCRDAVGMRWNFARAVCERDPGDLRH